MPAATESATTIATVSPTKRTRPSANALRAGTRGGSPSVPLSASMHITFTMPAAVLSAAVNTPCTPGIDFAASVFRETISAWARSLRRNTACSSPATLRSDV